MAKQLNLQLSHFHPLELCEYDAKALSATQFLGIVVVPQAAGSPGSACPKQEGWLV